MNKFTGLHLKLRVQSPFNEQIYRFTFEITRTVPVMKKFTVLHLKLRVQSL